MQTNLWWQKIINGCLGMWVEGGIIKRYKVTFVVGGNVILTVMINTYVKTDQIVHFNMSSLEHQ